MGTLLRRPERRNGHPHAITYAAIDMGLAYQSGVRENCRDAEIVFDKFHVMKLIGERVDDVRKAESAHGKTEAKKQLKDTLALEERIQRIYPNPNMARFDRIDHDYLWTAKAYQMRLALRKIYNTIPYQKQSADSRAGAIGSTESATKHLIGS